MDHFLQVLADHGILNAGNQDYFTSHLARYRVTLDMIDLSGIEHPRILELGGGGLAFTLLLRQRFPQAEVVIGEYAGGLFSRQRSITRIADGHTETFQAHSFNIETDPWPLSDDQFDLVLCMEILEHLMLDPRHVFYEAHRVLRPGGRLLVTTPNIASLEALYRVMTLQSPYLFGVFSRHGAYGRHNREYTPWEVHSLGECAGLDMEQLITHDVYPPTCDTTELAEQLADRLDHPHLRRQNIFYLGRKGNGHPQGYPATLYDHDPTMHRAHITLVTQDHLCAVHTRLRARVTLVNQGTYTWTTQGDNRTRLRVMQLSPQGQIVNREFAAFNLPGPVAPGASCVLDLAFKPPFALGHWHLRLDLVHEHVCWFSEARPMAADWPIEVVRHRYLPLRRLLRRLTIMA